MRLSSTVDKLAKRGLKYTIETNYEIGEKDVYCVNIRGGLFSDHIPCRMKVCYANMIRLSQNDKPLSHVLFTASCGIRDLPLCHGNRTKLDDESLVVWFYMFV